MHKLTVIASAGLIISVFSLSSAAYAQIGTDVYGNTSTSVGGAQVGANADTSVSSDEDMSADDTAGNKADADSSVTSDASSGAVSFSLSKDQAALVSVDAESAELSADAVVTSEDLSRFVTSRMKRDAHIEHVEASGDGVSVEYRKKARFLGFIPGSIRATAEVHTDGSIEISYPWYRFLFAVDDSDDAEAQLQVRVDEIMAGADLSTGLNAHLEAELIDALYTALRGSAVTDVSTGATADVSGEGNDY